MIRVKDKIRPIGAAIALAGALGASLVLLVPSASATVRLDDRAGARGKSPSHPDARLAQAPAQAVRSATAGSASSNDRVDGRATPAADDAAAGTRSAAEQSFDARDAVGLALLLAVLGLGTVVMLKNYAREKSVGWASIGGGGQW